MHAYVFRPHELIPGCIMELYSNLYDFSNHMTDMVEMEVHVENGENMILYFTLEYANTIRAGS